VGEPGSHGRYGKHEMLAMNTPENHHVPLLMFFLLRVLDMITEWSWRAHGLFICLICFVRSVGFGCLYDSGFLATIVFSGCSK